MTKYNKERVIGLDIIRLGLVLLIYLFHSHMHYKCDYWKFNDFISMGAISMTAFFMLSGYSLHIADGGKNLLDKDALKYFYVKRFWGIMPLYYFMGALYVIYLVCTGRETLLKEIALSPVELLGLQSYFSTLFNFSHNGGTWFVSCLLCCYFIYPFLEKICGFLGRNKKVCAIAVLSGILLIAPIVQHGFHLSSIYTNPFFRILEFIIGILIAQLNEVKVRDLSLIKLARNKYFANFCFLLLLLGVSIAVKVNIPMDYMLYSWIGLPCFIVLFFYWGGVHGSEPKIMLYLSKISYAFFLMQLFLWQITRKIFECTGLPEINALKIFISFSVCIIGASALHNWIEEPIKRRFLQHK